MAGEAEAVAGIKAEHRRPVGFAPAVSKAAPERRGVTRARALTVIEDTVREAYRPGGPLAEGMRRGLSEGMRHGFEEGIRRAVEKMDVEAMWRGAGTDKLRKSADNRWLRDSEKHQESHHAEDPRYEIVLPATVDHPKEKLSGRVMFRPSCAVKRTTAR
jgi:hypothetical protein